MTQLPGANALDVDRLGKAELLRLSKTFPPGLKYAVAFDTTTVIGESIRDVLITLLQAVLLVIFVIYVFLQDWRSTLIPAITIPVSLVGHVYFRKAFWIFDQYADAVRHHAGDRPGGGRRHRRDRKRGAAHR